MAQDKAAVMSPETCAYCAACESICPVNAIALPFLICLAEEELSAPPGKRNGHVRESAGGKRK
jgi:ferredoxin